jgi:NodT family efflux transporter outer membrane factor (OMF) lipoprotein
MRIFLSIILTIILSACAISRPANTDHRPADLPSQFSMYSEKADLSGKWWKDFDSRELDWLVDEALSGSFTVKEAWARLEQARYAARKVGADKYPELSYQAGGAVVEKKEAVTARTTNDEWTLGLTASYEVDLWGRVKSETESADLLAQASAEDLKTALMSVAGEIAEKWLSLVSNKQQQQLFTRQLALQKQLLQVIEARFPLARSTALDIYQQQQSIEQIETALIPLQSNEGVLVRQLALLTGKASISESRLAQEVFPTLQSLPAIGLPADLLASRPDVRSAGLRLKSGEWEISAAKADRLPALKLTASHTYAADDIGSIFDNWLLNLAANLTGPIFDGGRRWLEVERTKAVVDERIAAYSNTVFAAIKEVEDALAEEEQYERTMNALARQLELAEKTTRVARRRYLYGDSDFLNVLVQELNILQVQQDMIRARERMLAARIQLYRALGGTWVNGYIN